MIRCYYNSKLKEEYNTINTRKTEYMIAGYENDKSDLHLENEVIKYSPSSKYLGVPNPFLKWQK